MLDQDSSRVRFGIDYLGSFRSYTMWLMFINFVTLSLSLYTIRIEDNNKKQVAEHLKKKKEKELASKLGEDADGDDKDALEDQEIDKDAERDTLQKVCALVKFFVKCECQRDKGSFCCCSMFHVVDLMMNILVFCSIIYRSTLQTVLESYLLEAQDRDEFIDFSPFIWAFDIQNYFEIFIFFFTSFTFMKMLVEVDPDTFQIVVSTIIGFLFNSETLMIMAFQMYLYLAITYFMFASIGDYMFQVNSLLYSFNRVLIFILNGLFWEKEKQFGVEESMETVISQTNHLLVYFCIFITRLISQYIVFNIYVSKILVVLEKSRHNIE